MAESTSKIPGDPEGRCAVFVNGQRIGPSDAGFVACPTAAPVTSTLPAAPGVVNTTTNPVTNPATSPTPNPAINSATIVVATPPADPTSTEQRNAETSSRATQPIPKATSVASNGLQGGAVAGIAIGMLFAGVIIAGLVFLFVSRRQKRGRYVSHAGSHLPEVIYQSGPEKGPVIMANAVSDSIDKLLPQPDSDDTLAGEASKIRDNIKNHVRVYYHSGPLKNGISEAALLNVASATGLSTSTLVSALANPPERQETLRLVFAWVILSKATGGRSADLLPHGVSQLESAITGASDNNSKISGTDDEPTQIDTILLEQTVLHSKWKQTTALLLSQGAEQNDQNANRVEVFSRIIAEFDAIVAPCCQGHPGDAQRRKNLDMILTRASKFAFLLFSQPGSFRFDFHSRQGAVRAFPALVQTIGDQGQVLVHPRVLFDG